MPELSEKLCECGCGNRTNFASKTLPARGYIKGQPLSFVKGHNNGTVSHGHTVNGAESAEYTTWHNMKNRCELPTCPGFARYGGRGITICESWKSFANFLADMGLKPKGSYIDRINNDGNYEPSNCRWTTPKESASNRKNGHAHTLASRIKMSLAKMGKKQTPESNLKRSLKQTGQRKSPETIARMRIAARKRLGLPI